MGATVADCIAVITPVATQPLTTTGTPVDSERHITVRAHHHLPATTAPQKRAVAPSWHEDHRLFPLLRQLGQSIHQRTTDQSTVSFGELMPHVHHMDRRQRLLGDPLGQTSQMQGPIGMQLHPAVQ